MTYLVEVFSVDQPLADVMVQVVKSSSLLDKVSLVERSAGVADGGITEFHTYGLPINAWSTGEQFLWELLASMAGQTEVNLHRAAIYLGHGGQRNVELVRAFAVLLGVNLDGE